jgi:hypothetical protein
VALHPTAGFPLKLSRVGPGWSLDGRPDAAGFSMMLSRVGPGWSLDGRPDAAGSGVRGPVGGTLSSGIKKYPNAPGQ